uniref:Uncharacterized protein n=1 Tax=Polytomella parva TaxID=51329 RepID=A0A7S0V204_9CHLO|mmetsp:Transcript_28670/g.52702  ORF Transcript_28670/g.52702 Transcript_28670/m.52702 type:complete len:111 (+) Transcript_28670:165-497(+)
MPSKRHSSRSDKDRVSDFERRSNPKSREQQELLQEMRAHAKKLEEERSREDPRLTFSTPEFKEAQRVFTDNFKKNFGRPVEWELVREFPWSTPTLRRIETVASSSLPSES